MNLGSLLGAYRSTLLPYDSAPRYPMTDSDDIGDHRSALACERDPELRMCRPDYWCSGQLAARLDPLSPATSNASPESVSSSSVSASNGSSYEAACEGTNQSPSPKLHISQASFIATGGTTVEPEVSPNSGWVDPGAMVSRTNSHYLVLEAAAMAHSSVGQSLRPDACEEADVSFGAYSRLLHKSYAPTHLHTTLRQPPNAHTPTLGMQAHFQMQSSSSCTPFAVTVCLPKDRISVPHNQSPQAAHPVNGHPERMSTLQPAPLTNFSPPLCLDPPIPRLLPSLLSSSSCSTDSSSSASSSYLPITPGHSFSQFCVGADPIPVGCDDRLTFLQHPEAVQETITYHRITGPVVGPARWRQPSAWPESSSSEAVGEGVYNWISPVTTKPSDDCPSAWTSPEDRVQTMAASSASPTSALVSVSVLSSASSPSPSPSTSSSPSSTVGSTLEAGERVNRCPVCSRTYARPSTLKTHLRTHSGERPYACPACRKTFSQAANLTAHLRTHSGEKPFHCALCQRRFSQSSSVTTHMRTHSGERPYRCRHCRKAFSDSSTLTKHLRVHTGEKPYQCRYCLVRFSQSGNLNRHIRVHLTTGSLTVVKPTD
ncbi:unnamed protein product [Protopolystoma xenopodis]|uniref:C2H2-type domain-containing protein n=1 Tax=Protopolystoma xenopodis TaxID=117903 RepID=A0A448XHV6_9PLAT|nr:unnamed protein product [Protopolystoma xenopodis]